MPFLEKAKTTTRGLSSITLQRPSTFEASLIMSIWRDCQYVICWSGVWIFTWFAWGGGEIAWHPFYTLTLQLKSTIRSSVSRLISRHLPISQAEMLRSIFTRVNEGNVASDFIGIHGPFSPMMNYGQPVVCLVIRESASAGYTWYPLVVWCVLWWHSTVRWW